MPHHSPNPGNFITILTSTRPNATNIKVTIIANITCFWFIQVMLKFRVLQGLVEGDLVADNEYALGRLSLAADTSPLVADGDGGGEQTSLPDHHFA